MIMNLTILKKKSIIIIMNCLFIYNPLSGNGKIKKRKNYIVDRLKEKFTKIDVEMTEYAGHASILVKQNHDNYDYIIVGGGDGTFNEVVNAFANYSHNPIIGYIPCGTVNDLARTLKIPKNINKALKIILNGNVFNYDIFQANNKFGIYVCCSGVFTSSSYETKQKSKKRLGKIAYFFNGIKSLFTTKPFYLKARYEEKQFEGYFALMLLINSKSVAGFYINKNAVLNDGKIDCLFLKCPNSKRLTFMTIIRVFRVFLFGIKNVKKNKNFIYINLDNIDIECHNNTINIDGESAFKGSFNLSVKKEWLNIIVR